MPIGNKPLGYQELRKTTELQAPLMIKKFVSNALLSVFMDKQARDKLQARNSAKPQLQAHQRPSSDIENLEDEMVGGDPLENMSKDDVTALIRESLDEAEREIDNRKAKHTANPGRQALIDEAMSIQRSKRHIVEELPPEQREKLMFMALKTLGDPGDSGDKR